MIRVSGHLLAVYHSSESGKIIALRIAGFALFPKKFLASCLNAGGFARLLETILFSPEIGLLAL